jgi:hypothetical protein
MTVKKRIRWAGERERIRKEETREIEAKGK